MDIYKEEVKRTLLELSKENDKPEYEKAVDNDDIVDEIARDIRRAIENGCGYDWCFDTSKYGGFMDSYATAIEVFTVEKRLRVCKEIEATEEEIEFLRRGENPFESEFSDEEMEHGDIEWDFAAADEYGRTIVGWD